MSRITRLEAQNAALIASFLASEDTSAHELAGRMQRCRADRFSRRARKAGTYVEALRSGPQFKCKTVACWACRKAHVARKKKQATHVFASSCKEDCSWLTVNATEPCVDLNQVFQQHQKFRVQIDNWRDSLARRDRRFTRMALLAMLEVQHRGGQWHPHWHIVVSHPRVDWQEIAEHARSRWPGARRVKVEPFKDGKELVDSIRDCVGYGFKFDHGDWPVAASADLFLWIRQGHALRSMCITKSPRAETKPEVRSDLCGSFDPSPFIISSHIYPQTWSPILTGPVANSLVTGLCL